MKILGLLAVAVALLPVAANAAPKGVAAEAAELKAEAVHTCAASVVHSAWCRASYSASNSRTHALASGRVGSLPEQMLVPMSVTTRSRLISGTHEGTSGAAENNQLLQVVRLRPFYGAVRLPYVPTVTGIGASRQGALMDALSNYVAEACGLDLSSRTTASSASGGNEPASHAESRIAEHATCVVPGYHIIASGFIAKLDQWQVTIQTGD